MMAQIRCDGEAQKLVGYARRGVHNNPSTGVVLLGIPVEQSLDPSSGVNMRPALDFLIFLPSPGS